MRPFAVILLAVSGMLGLAGCFEKEVIREPDRHHELYRPVASEHDQMSVGWQR
jgi:hypothetical protein